jgi:hypothetical protein
MLKRICEDPQTRRGVWEMVVAAVVVGPLFWVVLVVAAAAALSKGG